MAQLLLCILYTKIHERGLAVSMRQHRVIRPLKSPRRTSLTIGLALCSYAAMVDSTMAQDAESAPSSRPIEEVMVTATKRETSMQDIPVAISAVTGESLEKSQTYDIESFARLDPAIQVNNRVWATTRSSFAASRRRVNPPWAFTTMKR